MNNPFRKFAKNDPPILVGRDHLIESILEGVTKPRRPDSFQITALRTMGTSSLLRAISHPQGVIAQSSFRHALLPPYTNVDNLVVIYLDFDRYDGNKEIAPWLYEKTIADERLKPYWGDIEPDNMAQTLKNMLINADKEEKRVVWLCDHFERPFQKIDLQQASAIRPLVSLASFVTATEEPLTDLNRDAAASLFSGQLIPLNIDPLSNKDGIHLLRKVLEPDPSAYKSFREYKELLPLLGYHPYFILRGGEQWYDIREKHPQSPAEALLEIAQDVLLNLFRPDFVRFWNHAQTEQALLTSLAKLSKGIAQVETLAALNRLIDKGLVVLEENSRQYQPFSKLWSSFILQETAAQSIATLEKLRKNEPTLTENEEMLLAFLKARPSQICSYDDILRNVWHSENTKDELHKLRQVVLRLRKKLERMSNHQGEIKNHRDKGYEWREKG